MHASKLTTSSAEKPREKMTLLLLQQVPMCKKEAGALFFKNKKTKKGPHKNIEGF